MFRLGLSMGEKGERFREQLCKTENRRKREGISVPGALANLNKAVMALPSAPD
jgi:hypothetical protein